MRSLSSRREEAALDVKGIRTPGLGDTTYVLTHDGAAIVVDPQRDIERFVAELADRSVELGFVLETHLHNDYVSGGREFATTLGATLVLPAASGAAFDHVPAFHNEDLALGDLVIRPIHTPGHTPEHTSYLVLLDDEPYGVFSGGSLLVGSAGRSDLLGMERARQLTKLQHGSVMRLAALPDEVGLYPTHGEGSFCTVTTAGGHTSTIGAERSANPVLLFDDADTFADAQLSGLQPFPSYYAFMGPLNLIAPARPTASLEEIAVADIPEDSHVVDIRPSEAFAAGHLPGSIGIPAEDATAVWAAWLLPFDATVVLVALPDQEISEIVNQFVRIGFDHVHRVVRDLGDAGTSTYRTVDVEAMAAAARDGHVILDVRAPEEWEAGHLEGSIHRYTPDLLTGLDGPDPGTEVWVACRSGRRTTVAAGLIERLGYVPVVLDRDGIPDVMERFGDRRPAAH